MTGKEIRQLRCELGLSQIDLAYLSGVSNSFISLFESEQRMEEYRALLINALHAEKEKRLAGMPTKTRARKLPRRFAQAA